jgi:uncharacterized membrane protein YdfJ with MMPL/SSD domain
VIAVGGGQAELGKDAVDVLLHRAVSDEQGAAITQGIASSAGVVTSAAVIMMAVFSIFATLHLLELKMLGIGPPVAVLIDATVVRGILVPAGMALLGDRSWYAPRWLGRVWPGHRVVAE